MIKEMIARMMKGRGPRSLEQLKAEEDELLLRLEIAKVKGEIQHTKQKTRAAMLRPARNYLLPFIERVASETRAAKPRTQHRQ